LSRNMQIERKGSDMNLPTVSMEKIVGFICGKEELSADERKAAGVVMLRMRSLAKLFATQRAGQGALRQVSIPATQIALLLGDSERAEEIEAAEGAGFYLQYPKEYVVSPSAVKLLIDEPAGAPVKKYLVRLIPLPAGAASNAVGVVGQEDNLYYICVQ